MPKKRSESGLLPHTVASAERGVEPDPEYLYLYLHLACGATSSTARPPVTKVPYLEVIVVRLKVRPMVLGMPRW